MDELFYELIRLSLGNGNGFSRKPTEQEWWDMFLMSEKHSLQGVSYHGLQRIDNKEHWPPTDLVIQWMGVCTQIEHRNRIVNKQCVEIQEEFRKEGFQSCILKGQGNLLMYEDLNPQLALLRQPGDIDVWVEGGFEKVIRYVRRVSETDSFIQYHVNFVFFSNTPVEVHFTPSKLFNRICNRRYQKWVSEEENRQFTHFVDFESGKVAVPTQDFNIVYQLSHIYRHLFEEGVGLRQLTDYYVLIMTSNLSQDEEARVKLLVRRFGMERFARSLMWVMGFVFHLEKSKMLWEEDEQRGRFVLGEIMKMGNFGHSDHRFDLDKDVSHLIRYWQRVRGKFRFVKYYPVEVLWQPIDILMTFFELRSMRRKANEIGRQMLKA